MLKWPVWLFFRCFDGIPRDEQTAAVVAHIKLGIVLGLVLTGTVLLAEWVNEHLPGVRKLL